MPKTFGQIMKEVVACKTEEEAKEWLDGEVERWVEEHGKDPTYARKTILSNIGYGAGYYDAETAIRIKGLFKAVHPILGDPEVYHSMTAGELIEKGRKYAEEQADSPAPFEKGE